MIIEDISPILPPSCLASINELGAVGSTENKTKIESIIPSIPNIFPKINIKIGKTICLAKLEIRTSFFDDFISFITSPKPTDKSPIGSAALLNISKVLFITIGNSIPKKLILPPITQATIKGFVIIDFNKYIKFSLSLDI